MAPALTRRLHTIVIALAFAALLDGCGYSSGAASRGGCDPNYKGACLDPGASDYDCDGGSGDGPRYTGRCRSWATITSISTATAMGTPANGANPRRRAADEQMGPGRFLLGIQPKPFGVIVTAPDVIRLATERTLLEPAVPRRRLCRTSRALKV